MRTVTAFSPCPTRNLQPNRAAILVRKPCTRVVIRASSTTVSASLASLLTSNGASFPKAEVSTAVDDNKPIWVASANISPGETILSVPDSLWLTQESVTRSSVGKLLVGLEPWAQLAILALLETGSAKSPNQIPLASLPEAFDSPLFWSSTELAALEGTQLLESAQGYMQFFTAKYQELNEGLFSRNPAMFPAQQFTFERFLWAVAAVRSRTHPPLDGDDIAVVPGVELVRHRKGCNNELKVVKSGFLGRGRSLVLEAGRAIRQGESITMDFGPGRLDSLMLLDYGVLDTGSSLGGYQLTVAVPDSDRNLDDKLDILESLQMGQSASFLLTVDSEPSTEMMAFLRMMQLCKQDSFLLESIFRDEVWMHMSLPVSEFNEGLVCEAMVAGARQALAGYPTSIREDLTLLKSGSLAKGSRLEMAVLVRLGEKEALDYTMRWFEGRQAELGELEYYQQRRLKRLGLLDDRGRTTYDSFFKDSIA